MVIVWLLCGYCMVLAERIMSNHSFFYTKIHFFLKKFASNMRATPSHLATQLYLRTLPWLFLSNTKNHTTPIGGRAYPVRHYPIAARLRTRKGYAILCIASFPQSGDSSDATLEVPFKALLHAKCSKYALFLYKNAFFPKKICVFAFFVVPLQPLSKRSKPRWRNR